MRAGSLRCFKVYVQTPSPYAPLPFIGTWGDSQIGTGVKNMAFKGVKGGFPRAVKNKPLLEFPCGVKRGVNQVLHPEKASGEDQGKMHSVLQEGEHRSGSTTHLS